MEKNLRLRSNRDFQRVYKRSKNYWNRHFTVLMKKNGSKTRVGFSITKKYGNAVQRNRIKRQLREIVRINRQALREGYDMIIIPKKNTFDMKYSDLEKSYQHLLSLAFREKKHE